ncbi:MAG: ABC transporter permease [Clostridiales bacterium]|nr:ABC transporter permease [Clostridiales bacterium]
MFLRLLRAEFKIIFKNIPLFSAGFIVLGLICGGFALFASEYIYSEEIGKIKIALYYPDEETSALMIAAIEKMESVRESLEIIRVYDEAEVLPMVERGEVYGGIVIPSGFVTDIIKGKNTPATIYLPKSGTVDSLLAGSYLSAGIGDLAAAQAGIYAFMEYLNVEGTSREVLDLNVVYLNAAFSREDIFRDFTVSATGSLTLIQHYALYGLVMFLLLLGITLSKTNLSPSAAVSERLKVKGIGAFKLYFANLITAFLFYTAAVWAAVGLLYMLPESLGLTPVLSLNPILGIFSTAAFCAVFVSGIFYIADFAGVLVILFFTLVCGLLSGAILPLSFLPDGVNALSAFMPVKIMGTALSALYDGSVSENGLILPGAAFIVVLLVIYIKDMVK